jgi:V/A-type H+/Na+-transporting ATPase subunit E
MPVDEQLQSLLDRIRSEGVERAEADAAAIVDRAHGRAADIVAEAEAEAARLRRAAEEDAEASLQRGEKALAQAARDFLLSLQSRIEAVLRQSLRGTVSGALTPETVAEMLVRLADAYAAHDMNESRVDVLLAPEDREALAALVLERYRELVGQGLTLRADEKVERGFRVSFADDNVYHDFTLPALAEALAAVLKHPLSEIVERAAQE